jgi:glutamine amidotransferase
VIKIIDYGSGNISALSNVFHQIGVISEVARCEEDLFNATKLILPGVGRFDEAMEKFEQTGMLGKVNSLVLDQNIPILGICVGMQLLANTSEEGDRPGLGWIDAEVRRFTHANANNGCRIPHMGWSFVSVEAENPLLKWNESQQKFYFLHSYYFVCHNPDNLVASANYGSRFACVVKQKNIFGVQFHPEKSHQNGVRLLKKFAEF